MRLKNPPVALTGKIERLVPGENVTLVNGMFYTYIHWGSRHHPARMVPGSSRLCAWKDGARTMGDKGTQSVEEKRM